METATFSLDALARNFQAVEELFHRARRPRDQTQITPAQFPLPAPPDISSFLHGPVALPFPAPLGVRQGSSSAPTPALSAAEPAPLLRESIDRFREQLRRVAPTERAQADSDLSTSDESPTSPPAPPSPRPAVSPRRPATPAPLPSPRGPASARAAVATPTSAVAQTPAVAPTPALAHITAVAPNTESAETPASALRPRPPPVKAATPRPFEYDDFGPDFSDVETTAALRRTTVGHSQEMKGTATQLIQEERRGETYVNILPREFSSSAPSASQPRVPQLNVPPEPILVSGPNDVTPDGARGEGPETSGVLQSSKPDSKNLQPAYADEIMKQMASLEKLQAQMQEINRRFLSQQRGMVDEQGDAIQQQNLHDTQTDWQLPYILKSQHATVQSEDGQVSAGTSSRIEPHSHNFLYWSLAVSSPGEGEIQEARAKLSEIGKDFRALLSDIEDIRSTAAQSAGRAGVKDEDPETARRRSTLFQNADVLAEEFKQMQQRLGWSPVDVVLKNQRERSAAGAEARKSRAEPLHSDTDEGPQSSAKRHPSDQAGEPQAIKRVKSILGGSFDYRGAARVITELSSKREEVIGSSRDDRRIDDPSQSPYHVSQPSTFAPPSIRLGEGDFADIIDPERISDEVGKMMARAGAGEGFDLQSFIDMDEGPKAALLPVALQPGAAITTAPIQSISNALRSGARLAEARGVRNLPPKMPLSAFGRRATTAAPSAQPPQRQPKAAPPVSERLRSTRVAPAPPAQAPPVAAGPTSFPDNGPPEPPFAARLTRPTSPVRPVSPARATSPTRPPNFYNVRLSNAPIFLRRTTIRPPSLNFLIGRANRGTSPMRQSPTPRRSPSPRPRQMPQPNAPEPSSPIRLTVFAPPAITFDEAIQTLPPTVAHGTQMTPVTSAESSERGPHIALPLSEPQEKDVGVQYSSVADPVPTPKPDLKGKGKEVGIQYTSDSVTSVKKPKSSRKSQGDTKKDRGSTDDSREAFEKRITEWVQSEVLLRVLAQNKEKDAAAPLPPPVPAPPSPVFEPRAPSPPLSPKSEAAALISTVTELELRILARESLREARAALVESRRKDEAERSVLLDEIRAFRDKEEARRREEDTQRREEAMRKREEEAARLAREEGERRGREQGERRAREEADRRALDKEDEIERRAREEREKREAERRAAQEAERRRLQGLEDERRRERDTAERERRRRERAEAAAKARAAAQAEELRRLTEVERMKREEAEEEVERLRLAAAEAERRRREAEVEGKKIAAAQAEKEKVEREKAEREKVEREKAEREALDRERAERQRRAERRRLERERLERERLELERAEAERAQREREEQAERRRREIDEEEERRLAAVARAGPADAAHSGSDPATMGSSEASSLNITTLSTMISEGEVLTNLYSEGEIVPPMPPRILRAALDLSSTTDDDPTKPRIPAIPPALRRHRKRVQIAENVDVEGGTRVRISDDGSGEVSGDVTSGGTTSGSGSSGLASLGEILNDVEEGEITPPRRSPKGKEPAEPRRGNTHAVNPVERGDDRPAPRMSAIGIAGPSRSSDTPALPSSSRRPHPFLPQVSEGELNFPIAPSATWGAKRGSEGEVDNLPRVMPLSKMLSEDRGMRLATSEGEIIGGLRPGASEGELVDLETSRPKMDIYRPHLDSSVQMQSPVNPGSAQASTRFPPAPIRASASSSSTTTPPSTLSGRALPSDILGAVQPALTDNLERWFSAPQPFDFASPRPSTSRGPRLPSGVAGHSGSLVSGHPHAGPVVEQIEVSSGSMSAFDERTGSSARGGEGRRSQDDRSSASLGRPGLLPEPSLELLDRDGSGRSLARINDDGDLSLGLGDPSSGSGSGSGQSRLTGERVDASFADLRQHATSGSATRFVRTRSQEAPMGSSDPLRPVQQLADAPPAEPVFDSSARRLWTRYSQESLADHSSQTGARRDRGPVSGAEDNLSRSSRSGEILSSLSWTGASDEVLHRRAGRDGRSSSSAASSGSARRLIPDPRDVFVSDAGARGSADQAQALRRPDLDAGDGNFGGSLSSVSPRYFFPFITFAWPVGMLGRNGWKQSYWCLALTTSLIATRSGASLSPPSFRDAPNPLPTNPPRAAEPPLSRNMKPRGGPTHEELTETVDRISNIVGSIPPVGDLESGGVSEELPIEALSREEDEGELEVSNIEEVESYVGSIERSASF
ncbi:hypothetical protein BDK51DRAFT_33181 [Blyttiomyces helicus]|uniref:Uncharacterized protein n=1 Tax=Blyttiomyces helicus TaxID=388810 RepID=A0A4P9WPJ7_9FUNG|nr:hypothetical protein BDK51DRAFT_33181 [Blyttiomyces helicus]|eukprot:RKO93668.1 hypothetical protein BDK51DRAFT_33181 [Blyttiomyces helicus]